MIEHNQNFKFVLAKLLHYEIISFNFFDCLVFRPVTNPTDMFHFLAQSYNIANFADMHVDAENIARKLRYALYGDREVTIHEIYTVLNEMCDIDIEEGIEKEYSLEKKLCYPNPYMQTMYNSIVECGKKIIVISNSYFPEKYIRGIAEACGYTQLDKIFVSCDLRKNKQQSALFRYIKENYTQESKVIHIGENYTTDVKAALKAGFAAHHYLQATKPNPKCNVCGSSYLIGSVYNAVTSNYLNNGFSIPLHRANNNNVYYKHGFQYGGIFIEGYVRFIEKYCREHNIDKIFFLAPGGDFLQKIYKLHGFDKPNFYLFWSPEATMTVMPELYMIDYFNHYVAGGVKAGLKLTGACYFNLMDITPKNNSYANVVINKTNLNSFKDFFLLHSKAMAKKSVKLKAAAAQYLSNYIQSNEHIVFVDIGWRASSALALKVLLNRIMGIDCEIHALVAGNFPKQPGYVTSYTLSKFIVPYMFSEFLNRSDAIEFNKYASRFIRLYEILGASSESPSFSGFSTTNDNNYVLNFSVPQVENYKIINEIDRGEIDFIKEFNQRIPHDLIDEFPGHDIYCFIKNALKNPHLFSDFKKYTYP